MKINTFNTGRSYTANGQRIAWAVVGDKVMFVDTDRMISGVTTRPCHMNHDLLYAYDNGLYSHLNDYEVRAQLEAAANSI